VSPQEIRELLHEAAKVRMPRFTDEQTSRERVDLLEDYLNLTAVTRGELEEARLYAQGALRDLTVQFDAIVGWEIHVKRRRQDVTKHDVTVAKAEIRPDLHAGMLEARWLVDRLSEQIHRISGMGDDQVASRLYTVITGS
jgi:hypothetical protein